METKIYIELLKDPRWQKKRLEVLQRDDFTCVMCGDKENTLHVHHDEYLPEKMPWKYNSDKLRTLCEDCHELVSNYEHGIEPLHKVFYKCKDLSDNTIYLLAWPWEFNIFKKTKEGSVSHIVYLPQEQLQKNA